MSRAEAVFASRRGDEPFGEPAAVLGFDLREHALQIRARAPDFSHQARHVPLRAERRVERCGTGRERVVAALVANDASRLVERPRRVAHAFAVREAGVSKRERSARAVSSLEQRRRIGVRELPHRRRELGAEAVVARRQPLGALGIEALELKERERPRPRGVARTLVRDGAFQQVPVRHVVTGLAQREDGPPAGGEIEPPLIAPQPLLRLPQRVPVRSVLPPREHLRTRAGVAGHGDDRAVVNAPAKDVDLRRCLVVRQRPEQVRRQHDRRAGIERPDERGQLGHHPAASVEEDRAIHAAGVEEPAEQPRLERRFEVVRRIVEQRALLVRQGEVPHLEHLKRLACRIERAAGVIREQHQAQPLRVKRAHGIHEHPRFCELTIRDDGADCCRHSADTSSSRA